MNKRRLILSLTVLMLTCSVTSAQTPSAVVGAGYNSPISISVAPGQVITLFVYGVGKNLSSRVSADRTPLPTTLAGISVAMEQSYSPNNLPVPIFGVEPIDTCDNTSPCDVLSGITVQIPFEMVPNFPGQGRPRNNVRLIVSENNKPSKPINVFPIFSSIHILRVCDTIFGGRDVSCDSTLVTHADGSLVSATNPAKSDEILILYAVGLGIGVGRVRTGEPTRELQPSSRIAINFDFRINASPNRPNDLLPDEPPSPYLLYAGLTPGLIDTSS